VFAVMLRRQWRTVVAFATQRSLFTTAQQRLNANIKVQMGPIAILGSTINVSQAIVLMKANVENRLQIE